MSIQSTQKITRKAAISRIIEMTNLLNEKNYREICEKTFEPEINLQQFVDESIPIDTSNIENWTDKMLSDQTDRPFFRASIFENYLIIT